MPRSACALLRRRLVFDSSRRPRPHRMLHHRRDPRVILRQVCQKQPLVATSSTHAEIKALYQLTIELISIINLCDELDREIELPAIIFEDNAPTIQLTDGLSARAKKSKHFLMLVNFVKDFLDGPHRSAEDRLEGQRGRLAALSTGRTSNSRLPRSSDSTTPPTSDASRPKCI